MAEIVYLGKRLTNKGKAAIAVVPLVDLPQRFVDVRQVQSLFDGKGTNFQTIGGIYEIDHVNFIDGRLSQMTMRGVYKEKVRCEYLPELEAADHAARLKIRADKEHEKAARDWALNSLLNRLTTIYKLTNNRQAFLLMVMERLMREKT